MISNLQKILFYLRTTFKINILTVSHLMPVPFWLSEKCKFPNNTTYYALQGQKKRQLHPRKWMVLYNSEDIKRLNLMRKNKLYSLTEQENNSMKREIFLCTWKLDIIFSFNKPNYITHSQNVDSTFIVTGFT